MKSQHEEAMQHTNFRFVSDAPARNKSLLLVLTYSILLLVFSVDVLLPLGIAVPILYVAPPACLTLWSSSKDGSG
jgi:hypothetical protein